MQNKKQSFKMFECLFQQYKIIPESLHSYIPFYLWWETVKYFWFWGSLPDAVLCEFSFTLQECWNHLRKTFL